MKITFFIHTPAQAHLWIPIIQELRASNIAMTITRDSTDITQILDAMRMEYFTYGRIAAGRYAKAMQVPQHLLRSASIVLPFKPDMIIGVGPIEATIAAIANKPCIIFEDSEPTPALERAYWKRLAKCIITPAKFGVNLGKKHFRSPSYKELAYLHPNRFTPDPSIKKELGLNDTDKYAILRFNAFDAVHDIGRRGFSLQNKYTLINRLTKYMKVFISPESKLPEDLERYELPVTYSRIHDALYYADLLVTDTQTMATEAAILGTPTIRCNSFVGPDDMSNFVELENDYDLMYSFSDSNEAINKAVELIQEPDLKARWQEKRLKLLEDKIDVTSFMVDLISRWPDSFNELKASKANK